MSESFIDVPPKECRKAAEHLSKVHVVTPILPLEKIVRGGVQINLFGKFENVQSVFTFKARGAEYFVYNLMSKFYEEYNANKTKFGSFLELLRLKKHKLPILVTASAGNHAQGVALAAKRYGLEAVIFMPVGTQDVKVERVIELGANVLMGGQSFDDSLERAIAYKDSINPKSKEERINHKGSMAYFVPPFENPDIMAGQGSVAVEILKKFCLFSDNYLALREYQWCVPDVIIAPIGGGGLVSGIGSVVKEFNQKCRTDIQLIGVQADAADPIYQSIKVGECRPSSDMNAKTIAEGIAVKKASERMINTVRHYVDQVVVVREEDILKGIAYIFQHPDLKHRKWNTIEAYTPLIPFRRMPAKDANVFKTRHMNKVEGAAAVSYAAVMFGDKYNEIDWREIAKGRKEINVVAILTGSNLPTAKIKEVTEGIERPKDLYSFTK